MFCGGEMCCQSCILYGIKNISVNGLNSLSDSTIYSGLYDGQTMILTINGKFCKKTIKIFVQGY